MIQVIFLQCWGGAGYLINKICFAMAERSDDPVCRRYWRIRSWTVYLMGLPAWVVVFTLEHNWIAAGVEGGGAPAMVMGLINARKGTGASPGWLDQISRMAVIMGLSLSIYEFRGLHTLSQWLELGIAAGFLMGTYHLAKNRISGYLWLAMGNLSCSALMAIQGYDLLMIQQLISLIFVTDAARVGYYNPQDGKPRN